MSVSEETKKCCATCMNGKLIEIMEHVLCEIHGIVLPDYVCKKYKYNLFMHRPKKKREIQKFSADDFTL